MNIFETFKNLPQSRRDSYLEVAEKVLNSVVRFEDKVRVPPVRVKEDGRADLEWEENNAEVLKFVDRAILKGLEDLKGKQEKEPLTMLVAAVDEVAKEEGTPAKALALVRLIGSYKVVQRYRGEQGVELKGELIKRGLIPRKRGQ